MKRDLFMVGHWPGQAVPFAYRKLCAIIFAAAMILAAGESEAFFGKRKELLEQQAAYAELMALGQYEQAATLAEATLTRKARKKEKKGEVDGRALLAYAHMAHALLWAGQHEEAIRRFDQVELAIKNYETRITGTGVLESFGAALLGNAVKSYPPKASDGVLVNTYKATAFLAMNRLDDARIEFNRADERTRRAVELFAKEIEREKEANKDKPEISDDQVQSVLTEHYGDLSQWAVYDDFVNPYTVYLHALYFFSAGQVASDLENAVTSMKRIVGMYPDNPAAVADLALFSDVAGGAKSRADIPDSVWLICEDGAGPMITSKDVDVAVKVDSQIVPLRLTLPELQFNSAAAGGCAVQGESGLVQAVEIASMDRVFRTEFKKRLPREVTQSIISMVVRGALQNEAEKKGGMLGKALGAAFQRETASTETRVWLGLPKAWYALRVARPTDGTLEVLTPTGELIATVDLPPAHFAVAHVRNPALGAYPASHVAVLAPSAR